MPLHISAYTNSTGVACSAAKVDPTDPTGEYLPVRNSLAGTLLEMVANALGARVGCSVDLEEGEVGFDSVEVENLDLFDREKRLLGESETFMLALFLESGLVQDGNDLGLPLLRGDVDWKRLNSLGTRKAAELGTSLPLDIADLSNPTKRCAYVVM